MRKFEWDETKNQINIKKHNVDFIDVVEIFKGIVLQIEDTRQDYGEARMIGFGYLDERLMVIVFTRREPDIIRIISARKANTREVLYYEQTIKNKL
jgi:uncharacterized DUF497 family protein